MICCAPLLALLLSALSDVINSKMLTKTIHSSSKRNNLIDCFECFDRQKNNELFTNLCFVPATRRSTWSANHKKKGGARPCKQDCEFFSTAGSMACVIRKNEAILKKKSHKKLCQTIKVKL
jgi:hypothetical protein